MTSLPVCLYVLGWYESFLYQVLHQSTIRNRKKDNNGIQYYTSTQEPQAEGNVTLQITVQDFHHVYGQRFQ